MTGRHSQTRGRLSPPQQSSNDHPGGGEGGERGTIADLMCIHCTR